MKEVEIFTDGACRGNPGPGGYGAVLRYGAFRKELAAGYRRTTNNRMEVLAAIAALEALREPCRITLTSDSRYLVDAVEKGWLRRWQRNAWRKADRQPVLNADLWQRLLTAMEPHRVRLVWVRGHADHAENNRCDQLAVGAATGGERLADAGFEEN